MAISSKSASGPVPVPENQNRKPYVATIDVIVTAESELAALALGQPEVDRVADLGRRLRNSHCDRKGGAHHGR